MSAVERIARGLTKAQIAVLCSTPELDAVPHSYWTDRLIASGGSVAQSLCIKGLMVRSYHLRPARRHARYAVTSLGLAVRQHLINNPDKRS